MKLKQTSVLNILKQIKAKNNNVTPVIFYNSYVKKIVIGFSTKINSSGNINIDDGKFNYEIDKKLLKHFDMDFLLDINNYDSYSDDNVIYLTSKLKYML